MKYNLFISYSTDPDYALSVRIENFLEGFHKVKMPSDVNLKSLQVCRDGSDFKLHKIKRGDIATQHDDYIKNIIIEYLRESEYLLVLCSKNSVTSKYVNFELEWFIENKGVDNVLVAITEGQSLSKDVDALFPKSIVENNLNSLIYYDFRKAKRQARNWEKVRALDEELIKLAAHLNNDTPGRILPSWRKEEIQKLKKQRYISGIVAAVFLLLALFSFFQRNQAIRQKEKANNELVKNYRNSSDIARRSNNLLEDLHYSVEALSLSHDDEITKNLLLRINSLPKVNLREIVHIKEGIVSYHFSGDNNRLLVIDGNLTGTIWNLETGKKISTINHVSDKFESSFDHIEPDISADGKFVLAMDSSRVIRVWNVENGKIVDSLTLPDSNGIIVKVFFTPDSKKVVVSTLSNIFIIEDIIAHKQLEPVRASSLYQPFEGNEFGAQEFTCSGNGKRMVFYTEDGTFKLFNAENGKFIGQLWKGKQLDKLVFMPDCSQILLLDSSHFDFHFYDATSGKLLRVLPNKKKYRFLEFSPDGKSMLLTTTDDDYAYLCNTSTCDEISKYRYQRELNNSFGYSVPRFTLSGKVITVDETERHAGNFSMGIVQYPSGFPIVRKMEYQPINEIFPLKFSPNGDAVFASLGDEGNIWDVNTGDLMGVLKPMSKDEAYFTSDGKRIITIGYNSVWIWGICFDKVKGKTIIDSNASNFISNPESKQVLIEHENGDKYWEIDNGNSTLMKYLPYLKCQDEFSSEGERIPSVLCYGKDGRKIITRSANDGSALIVWDDQLKAQIDSLNCGNNDRILNALFRNDGNQVLALIKLNRGINQRNDLVLFDIQKPKTLKTITGHFENATYSPDGKTILTCSGPYLEFWDSETCEMKDSMSDESNNIKQVSYSEDGKYFLTNSGQNVRVWTSKTKHQISFFKGATNFKNAIFSPDGLAILTQNGDNHFNLWETKTGRQIRIAEENIGVLEKVAFDRNGRIVIAADKKVFYFDFETDLDIPANLLKLQLMVNTGTSLNLELNKIDILALDEWKKLKKKWDVEARKHYEICNYKSANYWKRCQQ